MTDEFKIEYLLIAQNDIEEIFDYILKDNPSVAEKFVDKIDQAVSNLKFFPEVGSIPKELRLQRLGYRTLVVGNYLIFYVVKEKVVEIRRIIHGSRKYAFLL